MKVAIPVRFEKIPDLDLVGKLVLLSSFAGFLDGGEARNDLRAIKSNPGDDLAVPYGRLSPIGRNCVNYRQIGGGGLMQWEFEREGKELRVRTKGQLVVNDGDLAAAAVIAGAGLGYMIEEHALPYIAKGQLIPVLDEWCTPFAGLHLCYPSRQVTPALRALIDALRWEAP